MVLPGWNVTEPISAAAKFCQFVRKYRDASEEIKEFALQVDAFRQVLEVFDNCLKHPESVDVELRHRLRSVSDNCRQCAENCKGFIDRFFSRLETAPSMEIAPANKLLWVWNKEKVQSLGAKMQAQVNLINVHVNLAEWGSRQQSLPKLQRPSSLHQMVNSPPAPAPITPAILLGGLSVLTPPSSPALSGGFPPLRPAHYERRTHSHSDGCPHPHSYPTRTTNESLEEASTLNFSPSSDSYAAARANTRRFSLPDHVPQELGQGWDSRRTSYRWCPEMTMGNLVGAFVYRKYGSHPPLPVSKIEFLKDSNDNICYIVSSHANVKFFQKLSKSPPSIPHTEHPLAFKGHRLLRVKFLERQEFTLHMGPASVNVSASRDEPAPSPIALGSPAIEAIPSTHTSSSVIHIPSTVGSPSLPIQGSRVLRDTPYPVYEFQIQKDYKEFQERIMGRTLLVNAPIESVEAKSVNSSRLRQESEKQYLRLWAQNGAQTIMYHANSQPSAPIYVEHDVELFRPNEPKATSTRLVLDIKRTDLRQISEALRTLDQLVIVFSDAKDKTLFLEKARFYGAPNPAMIPPLEL